MDFKAHSLVLVALACAALVQGQKYAPSGRIPYDEQRGEQVDKMTRFSGDLSWPPAQSPDRYRRVLGRPQRQEQAAEADPKLQVAEASPFDERNFERRSLYLDESYPTIEFLVPNAAKSHNYYAPLDEVYVGPLDAAYPKREGRAFRPRLMSTARGFGKRSVGASEGRPAGGAISSKYHEWFSQGLSRYPVLEKHANSKFLDYNGSVDA